MPTPTTHRKESEPDHDDDAAERWWRRYFAGEDDGPTEAELATRLYQSDVRPLGALSAALTASAWTAATTSPTPRIGPHGQRGIPPIDASSWLRLGRDGYTRALELAFDARAYLSGDSGPSQGRRQAALRAELRRLVGERCGKEGLELLDAVIDGSLREADGGGVDSKIARSTVAAAKFATLAYAGSLGAAAELNSRVKHEYPWLPVDEHGEVLVWRGVRPGAA